MALDYELQIMSHIKVIDYFNDSKSRKDKITRLQMNNMLRRLLKMFKWTIPDETVTARSLELFIMTKGFTGVVMVEGKPYAIMAGHLGGEPNVEYMPTKFVAANPALGTKLKTEYNIYGPNKDVVIFPNDALYQGVLPTLSFHSQLLTEINLTKRCIMIKKRDPDAYIAPTDNAKSDIEDYLKRLENGDISAILDKNILNKIATLGEGQSGNHNIITQVLEMEQYQKAAFYNDFGMQMNYNMKRETITSSEAQLGEGALLPFSDEMMEMRKQSCKELKETFDLNWGVEFSSAWSDLRKSIQFGLMAEENEVENSNPDIVHSSGNGEVNEDVNNQGTNVSEEDREGKAGSTETATEESGPDGGKSGSVSENGEDGGSEPPAGGTPEEQVNIEVDIDDNTDGENEENSDTEEPVHSSGTEEEEGEENEDKETS